MSKKCPDCGSLNVEEVFDNEAYCKDCFLHCAADDLEDASVFERITASPDVLVEKLVYLVRDSYNGAINFYWRSTIIDKAWKTKSEAIAATLERLKELEVRGE